MFSKSLSKCAADVLCHEQKKHTHAVWLHSDSVWDVRENTDGVSSDLLVEEAVALEVKAYDVTLWTQPWQVPCDFIPLTHGQAWEVIVDKPIDG